MKTLLPMYFSLVRTWWTVPRVQGRPRSVLDAPLVEQRGDLAFQPASVDELAVYPPDGLDFLFRSGHEDHPVCLQALALTPVKNALRLAILVDAHAAQPVARHAALAVAALDKPALTGEHLFGEFAAVIGGHIPTEALHHRRHRAAVVDESIHAVVDLDPGLSAGEFEGCGLVLILKPAPSAYVVDQDRIETGLLALRVRQHLLHAGPGIVSQAASRLVRIGGDELHVVLGGVALDDRHLVIGRVLLEVSRHSEVGDGTPSRLRLFGIRSRLGVGLAGHWGLIFGVAPLEGASASLVAAPAAWCLRAADSRSHSLAMWRFRDLEMPDKGVSSSSNPSAQ